MEWEIDWRSDCEAAAIAASKGDGCSYEVFVGRLSAEIDRMVSVRPVPQREAAISIARDFGYASAAEREAMMAEVLESGFCRHGIDLGCCPVGCE